MPPRKQTTLERIQELAALKYTISEVEVRTLIRAISDLFRIHLLASKYPDRQVRAIITKFRDAGRRSAPWKPASALVPGRPQHGEDGNRRSRWLFDVDHKYYADEVNATLVEVKYFLQTLSMAGAPPLPDNTIQHSFVWLVGHPVIPNQYLDPIQLIPISLDEFVNNPRTVQSGHFIPLDRGGRHVPSNTFLMLARSNQLQGNLTLDELLELMASIVEKHTSREGDSNLTA